MRKLAAALVLATLAGGGCTLGLAGRSERTEVQVATTPAGATLILDGVEVQPAPATLTGVAAGTHLLVARKDGCQEIRRTFSLLPGQKIKLELALEELTGLVLVHSTPAGADVTLNSAFRGKTPLLITDFPMGRHRLQLSLVGFFPREVEVTVRDRIPQWVKADLTSDSASLEVTSEPSGAAVLINGSNRGVTPCRVDQIPSGQIELEVQLAGYKPHQEKLNVKAGETLSVQASLRAQPGALEVVTLPGQARVYVDNQFRGESPQVLENLAPGEHRLRVELRGYEPDARGVTIRAGEKTVEEFRLVKNSGVLMLVTEPPGAQVFIDGTKMGETRPAPSGLVSESLEIGLLSRGEHTLQLQKAGYSHQPRKFMVNPDKAVTLHERMARLFIPDLELRIRADNREDVVTGVLLKDYPGGDVEVEIRPGVIQRFAAATILSRRTIRAP
jgi:hypothetical protein